MAACREGLIRQTPPGRGSSVASVPIHMTIFAGSVKYSKTLSGLAATRTSCSTRLSVLLCSAAISLDPLLPLGDLLQPRQTARQNLGEKVVQLREPLRSHAQNPPRALAALAHQPDVLEHLEVLGDRGLCDREVRRNLAGAQLPARQQPEHLAPLGLGDCVEHLHRA